LDSHWRTGHTQPRCEGLVKPGFHSRPLAARPKAARCTLHQSPATRRCRSPSRFLRTLSVPCLPSDRSVCCYPRATLHCRSAQSNPRIVASRKLTADGAPREQPFEACVTQFAHSGAIYLLYAHLRKVIPVWRCPGAKELPCPGTSSHHRAAVSAGNNAAQSGTHRLHCVVGPSAGAVVPGSCGPQKLRTL